MLCELLNRRVQIKAKDFAARLELMQIIRAGLTPRGNCALVEGKTFIRNNQVWIKSQLIPQTTAFWTSPVRAIKRKNTGGDFIKRYPAIRAGKLFAENPGLGFGLFRQGFDNAIPKTQRGLDRFIKPFPVGLVDSNPINHNFDIMLKLFIKRGDIFKLINFTIDPDTHESIFLDLGYQALVFPFSPPDNRGQNQGLFAIRML